MNTACSARNSCPQRAQHAINDHFHSYATGKTIDGHGAPLPTKKTLTLINGPLADINVEKPREAQISTYEVPGNKEQKRESPHEKSGSFFEDQEVV